MTLDNVVFACAQIACLVLFCAPLPRMLVLRAPAVQYLFWRVLLAICLLLPIVQPRVPVEMTFVPAPAGAALLPPGTDAPPALAAPPAPGSIDWWWIAGLAIAAGAVLRLAWMAIGLVRLRRMRRHAVETAPGFDDLARAIGVAAPILWSRDVAHPVTFGVFRPVVLLPIALQSANASAQQAVVAHELHHAKRRDWLWVIAEEALRSMLWFHPAIWWLISRVQLARETVVDELSILTTNARRTYLDTLLAFADDAGLRSSPAFSARRHLFHRVMLLSREEGMSSIRIAVCACVLAVALAAGSWGAVAAFPLHADAQLPPPPPPPSAPRDPLPIDAYVRSAVEYLTTTQRDSTLSDAEKQEALRQGIAALDRALEINPKRTDAMLLKSAMLRAQINFTSDPARRDQLLNDAAKLREDAIARREQAIREGTANQYPANTPPPPPPPPMRPADAPPMSEAFERLLEQYGAVQVGGDVKMPAKVHDVRPVYPESARTNRVQGVVILEVIVDVTGHVVDARIVRSIPAFDDVALDAARQWVFAPPQVHGAPSAVRMTLMVNFKLE